MAKKKASSKQEPSFEQSLDQLEAIIDRIESGEVGLEQCLGEYEQGVKLIAHCRKVLEKAESRIAKLTTDAGGKLRVESDSGDGSADDDSD